MPVAIFILVALLLLVCLPAVSIAGLLIVHPVIHRRQGLISQEVVGHAFGVMGVLYGILPAFSNSSH